MPLTITRFAPDNLSSGEVTKSFTDPRPASYKLEYFDVSGVAGVPRDILSYAGADWEDKPVAGWPEVNNTPFGVFPVLHIRTEDGLEVKLAESVVIEHYLAKKFNLLGDNEWEEQQIKMFHYSTFSMRDRLFMRVTWNYKDVMKKAMDTFLSQGLPIWIETHTKHLKDNGSNGHYVGNRLSLADLLTANTIDHFECIYRGEEIIEMIKKSPEIWKVKETVDNDPKLQQWRKSDGYKKHIATSHAMYKNTGI